ncbi:MAG: acetate--CoA ligase family protein [Nitrospinota bacterium]
MTPPSSLSRLLRPASVAIVGLSEDLSKHGGRVLSFLRKIEFEGPVWGVNPKTPGIEGVEIFPSLREVPGSPDAVVLAVPPPAIPRILEDAGKIHAGGAIIFSGGFAETGNDGEALQKQICGIARAGGVRLLGPNSAGIIHPSARTILSFLTCLERPMGEIRPGPVGLITQSGGTGSYIHNLAAERGGGLAISVSTGNEADIELGEVFYALVEDPEVHAIALLLESVRHGPRFIEAAHAARAAGKAVVACKIGRTKTGHEIMRTHTGALAGPARTYEAVFESLGIVSVKNPAELFEVAEIMARAPIPNGDGVGIVTHSGGAAIMLADRSEELHISLPEPSQNLKSRLAPYLQMGASGNPADLGGIVSQPERYPEAVRLFLEDGAYDLVVPVSTPHPSAHSEDRARTLIELARLSKKPILNLWLAGDLGKKGLDILCAAGMATATNAESLLKAVEGVIRLGEMKRAQGAEHDAMGADPMILERFAAYRTARRHNLSEEESKAVLREMGIPTLKGEAAADPMEAVRVAHKIGYPVALKVISTDLPHKSEAGGVRLNLKNEDEVRRAWEEMMRDAAAYSPQAAIEGGLVEEFAPGTEMILGIVRDATFGPMVLAGTGGIHAETMKDVALALPPVSEVRAARMIASLRGRRLLQGFRGAPPADERVLCALIARLSGIAIAYRAYILELDLNPVIFSGGAWRVADALIRLA